MNRLPLEKRIQVLSMLCEGSSMRAIARVVGISINTVTKLLVETGTACAAFHDETVRGVKTRRVQCDEIWSFNYCKAINKKKAKAAPGDAGDAWTWTAIDADSKLIVSWLVGDRDSNAGSIFLHDLKRRLANRVQLTSDGHGAYLQAVSHAFADEIDYAMLVKLYGPTKEGVRRYSPPVCIGARGRRITGKPDKKHISTSYAEAHNMTMRMSMRRFTRLTNAHSKKLDNHCHALALYFVWYNFARVHNTLRASPAIAAGLTDKLMDMADIVRLTDEYLAKEKRAGFSVATLIPN